MNQQEYLAFEARAKAEFDRKLCESIKKSRAEYWRAYEITIRCRQFFGDTVGIWLAMRIINRILRDRASPTVEAAQPPA